MKLHIPNDESEDNNWKNRHHEDDQETITVLWKNTVDSCVDHIALNNQTNWEIHKINRFIREILFFQCEIR